ncbi:MAG TPA: glycosyltransferase family 4 protein [Pyrinomonadaceae bacterium]|jgi:glycosyltransferase involved in cell wall biosynthesis|nr:glycosyltransferase family 4 protein [Pyrinomonadaceae bacterium]
MRILQVSSARAFGGGERHLADLSRSLASRGHEVYAALAPDSPLRGPLLEALPPGNVFDVPLRNALDLRGATRLARLARESRADIIHAHVARDYTLASFAARRARPARLVITRHVLFPLSRMHRRALSNASRVIAVSDAVARALRAQSIFAPEKIRVVANGVDLRRFEEARAALEREAAESGTTQAPLRVGIVGELSEVKGQEDFVRAAAILQNDFGSSVEFLVVGCDTSRSGEYGARLQKLVAELRLTESVRLLGRRDDIAPLIASLDVLVSASRTESFGMVLAEAAACGVPAVATATEGAREIIDDGVTGSIVPIGDVRALASSVASLLKDESLRRSLGLRARESARARFGLERMTAETERVYAEALGVEASGGLG